MNVASCLLWGFVGTVAMTTLLAGSQGLGLTRMSMPYLLGSALTPNRDRARVYGIVLQMVNGWLFAFLYVALFLAWGGASWWKGALVGFAHAAFVLTVMMPALPGMHPRMASETHGPTAGRQLEPPGFLALHYGTRTPIVTTLAHVVFGVILGAFYRS